MQFLFHASCWCWSLLKFAWHAHQLSNLTRDMFCDMANFRFYEIPKYFIKHVPYRRHLHHHKLRSFVFSWRTSSCLNRRIILPNMTTVLHAVFYSRENLSHSQFLSLKLICSYKLLLYNFLCSDKLSAFVKGPSCRAIQIIRADTTTCFDRIKLHKIAVRTRSAQKLSTISDIQPSQTSTIIYTCIQ